MNLLDHLSRAKQRLKPTETRVTTATGEQYVEHCVGGVETRQQVNFRLSQVRWKGVFETPCNLHYFQLESAYNVLCPGFVVDSKPDLTVSQILPWLYLGSQDVARDWDILRWVIILSSR